MPHEPSPAVDAIAAQAIRNAPAHHIDPYRVAVALGIDLRLVPDLLATAGQPTREERPAAVT